MACATRFATACAAPASHCACSSGPTPNGGSGAGCIRCTSRRSAGRRAPGPGVAEEPTWPYGGDGVTIAVGEYDPAAPYAVRVVSAYRLLVDLASPAIALSALVPGASEHPSDPLRMEAIERWLAGRPGVFATNRFLVEDAARGRLVLQPAGAAP